MKLPFFILIILSIYSCKNQKTTDYSKINSLNDITEYVINDFYLNILDTLIGDCYFQSKPILNTDLIKTEYGYEGLSDSDQIFFKKQIEKFETFRWENIYERDKIISDNEMDSIFQNGPREGWQVFRNKYGKGCICFISIPLFTKDFKKVYIDYGQQCAAL